MRVLIVDDEPLVRLIIREVLAGLATAIDECADGDARLRVQPREVLEEEAVARHRVGHARACED